MHTGFIPALTDGERCVISASEIQLAALVLGGGIDKHPLVASKSFSLIVAADILHTLGVSCKDFPDLLEVLAKTEKSLHLEKCSGVLHFPEFIDRPMTRARLN